MIFFDSTYGRIAPTSNDLKFLNAIVSNTHTYHTHSPIVWGFIQLIAIIKIIKNYDDVKIIIDEKDDWKIRCENHIKRTNIEKIFNICASDIFKHVVDVDATRCDTFRGGIVFILLSDHLAFEITRIYDSLDINESISKYIDDITAHYKQVHVFSSLPIENIFVSKSFQIY